MEAETPTGFPWDRARGPPPPAPRAPEKLRVFPESRMSLESPLVPEGNCEVEWLTAGNQQTGVSVTECICRATRSQEAPVPRIRRETEPVGSFRRLVWLGGAVHGGKVEKPT